MFEFAASRIPQASALAIGIALGLAALQPAAASLGPFQRFVGDWTGGGQVVGSNGDRERIRCRARYSESEQGESLNQSIVCASESYRIDITSFVQASGDSVQGDWREATRDISGHVTGRIANGRFEGAVVGPGFSAQISLTSDGRRQALNIEPSGGDISQVRVELHRR